MAVHTVGIEGDHDMRTVETYTSDQLFADAGHRRVCEMLVPIVEEVHLGDPEDISSLTELSLAATQRGISEPSGVASGRCHERNGRPALHIAAYQPCGRKALIVWMREDQEDSRWNWHAANIPDAAARSSLFLPAAELAGASTSVALFLIHDIPKRKPVGEAPDVVSK